MHRAKYGVLYFDITSRIFRSILHDLTIYPDPDAFKPERFLNADGSQRDDPVLIAAFGFGKQICLGRYFADSTLFIVVASLFAVFRLEKGKGTDSGPDPYPYTGTSIRYRHRACLQVWN
jgi:cytochrome P450